LSTIQFFNKTKGSLGREYPRLRRIIRSALESESLDAGEIELSVVFTSDLELQQLNKTYRQIDSPTDVLAFPADTSDPETGKRYIGDIVISMEQVGKQHSDFGDPENDILSLLVIHGTLHLLGYDHATKEEKQDMWKIQSEILSKYQIEVNIPE
jgi:probable rRNA maturation factor